MRWFETRGPVYPEDNYVVARTEELADFVDRLEKGRYIVLFAPRQTGKTTFFRNALEVLGDKGNGYFPIQLNFEMYVDIISRLSKYRNCFHNIQMKLGNLLPLK